MIKKTFLILIFSFISVAASAQSNHLWDEGSIYSKFGLGMPQVYGSPAAEGMGLWGVSFIEPNVPGVANPAHWGSTVYATATGGISLTSFHSQDKFGNSRHNSLTPNHFQLVVPIYKGKLGLSAALIPYTNTSYKITERGENIINQDTLQYVTRNFGSGGINKIQVGLGWRINNNISIGYAASFVFGQVDNTFLTLFEHKNSFSSVDNTIQTNGWGFGHRFGLHLNFSSVLAEDDNLSFGASLTLPVELEAEQELETVIASQTSEGEPKNNLTLDTGNIQLPMGIMAGLTYAPLPKLSFSVEGLYQEWSAFKNSMDPNLENAFVNRYKIGAGLRYFPFINGTDTFLSQFKYRLGVSYDQGHLKLKGNRIETLMFSVGLGYITPFTNLANSSIDISFHYGIRGTKANNLVKENIWKVKLSINLAELFFYRPKVR